MTAPTPVLITALPGPDRKRSPRFYQYRLAFRNPEPGCVGCVATWDVVGGREPYRVDLERSEQGGFYWHCSCADATFRGAGEQEHFCKHVRALADFAPIPGARPGQRRSA
jgi:hypothetical protein